MSIFNEIKRNVSGAASVASKKTTELTEIAKIKVNIKLEKAKLSECYEEIGRLFYTAERSGEDYTSDIAAYIMQADKIKATIAKYKTELAKLRKIVICEGCGAEISDTAAYCSVCGTKQVKKCCSEEAAKAEPCCCECDGAPEEESAIKDVVEDITEEVNEAVEEVKEFFCGDNDDAEGSAE
ncbi:MAG: zinc-ribbon domain-containing protein [Ruminococcaceae bacterium]|nr:zinc-ribbon domain-containing protein [Oscillospiraceae bacterium]